MTALGIAAMALLLALAAATAVILLWLRVKKAERAETAAENRIRELVAARLGHHEANGDSGPRRRHLWLVPVFAGLSTLGTWVKTHTAQIAIAAGLSAIMSGLLIAGSPQPDNALPERPDPPLIVGPPTDRTPSSTSDVPPPDISTTTSPGGGAPPQAVSPETDTTQLLLPPASVTLTTTVPSPTTTTAPPPSLPSTPTEPPEVPADPRCLVKLEVRHLAAVCVPIISR